VFDEKQTFQQINEFETVTEFSRVYINSLV